MLTTDSPQTRFCLPHWSWFLLATVALAIGLVGLSIWLPWHREQHVIQMIESWGGKAGTQTDGPEWLRHLVGEYRMKDFKVFDRVVSVQNFRTPITDAEIVHLNSLTNLNFVWLDHTAVTVNGLAQLSRFTKIEALSLSKTAVTDSALAQLSGFTNLDCLHLHRTAITDEGLSHLSGMTSLITLSLDDTAVTDTGLTHLGGLTNLRFLNLRDTAVTDKGIKKLNKALPDCRISH